MNIEPLFFKKETNNEISCSLCPHRCRLKPGGRGICGVRTNHQGEMELPYAGCVSAIAMDPVEKKPLFHFYPGSQVFSVGFYGCSFSCPFCQNFSISQHYSTDRIISPEDLVKFAMEREAGMIAYTYNEPTVHIEYIIECSKQAKEKSMKNVIVTNGHLNKEPAEMLFGYMDAANIDLKSINPEFYRKEIKGNLEPVKETISIASGLSHVEVTTLVIPGKNDSDEEIEQIAVFLSGIDENIPLHLSAYYPTYKYSIPSTPSSRIFDLVKIARTHLKYVYPGNVGNDASDTLCGKCHSVLIERRGYSVRVRNGDRARCDTCGEALPYLI